MDSNKSPYLYRASTEASKECLLHIQPRKKVRFIIRVKESVFKASDINTKTSRPGKLDSALGFSNLHTFVLGRGLPGCIRIVKTDKILFGRDLSTLHT